MQATQNSDVKAQNHNSKLRADLRYRSFQFSLQIIELVKGFPDNKIYRIFTDQLLRSATSIGANIIEAKSSSSRREFLKYYEISLKSANETIYWLNLLKDANLVEAKELFNLLSEIDQITRMLSSSVLTLKGKRSY